MRSARAALDPRWCPRAPRARNDMWDDVKAGVRARGGSATTSSSAEHLLFVEPQPGADQGGPGAAGDARSTSACRWCQRRRRVVAALSVPRCWPGPVMTRVCVLGPSDGMGPERVLEAQPQRPGRIADRHRRSTARRRGLRVPRSPLGRGRDLRPRRWLGSATSTSTHGAAATRGGRARQRPARRAAKTDRLPRGIESGEAPASSQEAERNQIRWPRSPSGPGRPGSVRGSTSRSASTS